MHIRCPHCKEDIELIGSVVLKKEFELGPNAVSARREVGTFPKPVLDLGNRLLWLRQDVEDAVAKETETKILDFVSEIERDLQRLPEDEQAKAREVLAKKLNGGS